MVAVVDLEYFADLEDDGRLQYQGSLVVEDLQHDRVGPCFHQTQLGVRELTEDSPVPRAKEIDNFGVESEDDILLEAAEHFLEGGKDLVVHSHLKLEALVEVAICDNLNDDEGQGRRKTVLTQQHPLHFPQVYPELLLTHLVLLLCHLPDVEA